MQSSMRTARINQHLLHLGSLNSNTRNASHDSEIVVTFRLAGSYQMIAIQLKLYRPRHHIRLERTRNPTQPVSNFEAIQDTLNSHGSQRKTRHKCPSRLIRSRRPRLSIRHDRRTHAITQRPIHAQITQKRPGKPSQHDKELLPGREVERPRHNHKNALKQIQALFSFYHHSERDCSS